MKKLFLACILLLVIMTATTVSAQDNLTDSTAAETDNMEVESDNANLMKTTDEDIQANSTKDDLNVEIAYPSFIQTGDVSDYVLSFKNVPDDYSENAEIYIDGVYDRPINVHSSDEINIPRKASKTYTILAVLPESDKYNAANVTFKCLVDKTYIEIPDKIDAQTTPLVRFYAQNGATGTFTVKVNGKVFKKIDVAKALKDSIYNEIYVDISSLDRGVQTVEATYSGGNYAKLTKKAKVNVTGDFEIDIYPEHYDLFYGEENAIILSTSANLKYYPKVMIDGEELEVTTESGNIYYVNVTHLWPGEKNVIVTYQGDGKYAAKTFNQTIPIYGHIVIHHRYFDYVSYGEVISIMLGGDAVGNLSMYLNETLHRTVPLIDGKASITVDVMGEYFVRFNYTGSDYEIVPQYMSCMIGPNVIIPEVVTYNDERMITVEFINGTEGNVTFKTKTAEYQVEIQNNTASFPLKSLHYTYKPNVDSSSTKLQIIYQYQNKTYTHTETIVMYQKPAKLLNGRDITMYYGDSKTYSLKVLGGLGTAENEGQRVTVKIGSKTYYPKTDRNGMIKLKIDEKPGTYKIITTYKGAKATNKLVVKQPLSLKTVPVKKSAGKLILQSTLKKGKTPLKNKQITFKFNGKTFKTKTNKNGIAKVTVSKAVLSKLSVGKKVTYQATYLKDTVKKTTTVKK